MYCFKSLLVAGLFVLRTLSATTVVINGTASHKIPPTLWGAMFEDINHSGDGGLYAELLQNRAFQKVTPNTTAALNAWHSINGASLTVIADPTPVSSAIPNSLQLSVPVGTKDTVGFGNEGYWGIKVDSSWTYKASFYYRLAGSSNKRVSAKVSIVSSATGKTFASKTVTLQAANNAGWNKVSLDLKPGSSTASTANNFTITFNGGDVAGQTIDFALFSLFPPTFNNRENGLRLDLGEALKNMGPKLFRFPGGNNLEGETLDTRWKWNETLGDLVNRPGRRGDWGYVNTDGLGLMEYLTFVEDLGMEPVMGVWAGYALNRASVAENALEPYIEEAKQQIYFVIGDPATNEAAALRASLGRKEPFKLKYVEIGNEDFLNPTTYTYRWRQFYGNLSAEFPQLTFMATTRPATVLDPAPPSYDLHVYQTPRWYASNSFYYDSFARDGTLYFEGEYAATSTNSSDIYGLPENGRMLWPTIWGSVGEAAFMTGLERNSDIVFSSAYAPWIQHVNGSQWTPDLISFDAGQVYLSTSYYVQQMFSESQGDEYLPSTLPTAAGTVFWSVTRSSDTLFLKVSNTNGTPADLSFEIPSEIAVGSTGSLKILQGDQYASNNPSTPHAAEPTTASIAVGQTFGYTAPGFSFSVISVPIAG